MAFVLTLVVLIAYQISKICDINWIYMNIAKMETCIEILSEENTYR